MLYDISLAVSPQTVTFPGDPSIRFHPALRLERGEVANLTAMEMCVHTGTHFDAPWHFIDHGARSDQVPLENFLGPALVVEIPDARSVGRAELESVQLNGVERLLLKTRNSALLHDSVFHEDFTYLTKDGAEYLVSRGIRLVAIDYFSIDRFGSKDFPAHHVLLGANVVIVEAVDLSAVPPGHYELLCLPMKLSGVDGAPVRAVLRT